MRHENESEDVVWSCPHNVSQVNQAVKPCLAPVLFVDIMWYKRERDKRKVDLTEFDSCVTLTHLTGLDDAGLSPSFFSKCLTLHGAGHPSVNNQRKKGLASAQPTTQRNSVPDRLD